MDEMENKAPEEPQVNETTSDAVPDAPKASDSVAADAAAEAKDAAKNIAGDAEKTLNEIKGMGLMSFFSFDRMLFPLVARYVFIILCLFSILGVVLGVLASFIAIFTTGILTGILGVVGSVLWGAIGLVFTRFWFEFMLVGFKINENIQLLREQADRGTASK